MYIKQHKACSSWESRKAFSVDLESNAYIHPRSFHQSFIDSDNNPGKRLHFNCKQTVDSHSPHRWQQSSVTPSFTHLQHHQTPDRESSVALASSNTGYLFCSPPATRFWEASIDNIFRQWLLLNLFSEFRWFGDGSARLLPPASKKHNNRWKGINETCCTQHKARYVWGSGMAFSYRTTWQDFSFE